MKFNKTQLLTSNQFTQTERDVMHAVLDSDKEYSITEVKKQIRIFLERVVE